MTAHAPGDPNAPERIEVGSLNLRAAGWARAFFLRPSRVVALLWAVGAVAVGSVVPLYPWSGPALVALVVPACVAVVLAGMRAAVGERLPHWSLQVDVGLGNLLVSVVAAAGASQHVDLANLYLLVEVFALLYLPLRSALGHLAAAGVAYALVLGVGPARIDHPVDAWLAVFATGAAVGVVVAGLMSVLRTVAREDPLTGLANRRSWDERLDAELERARRSGEALSVVVVDLDGFKAVNDAHGHHSGDRLLQVSAASWQAVTRGGGDLVARLGGDEFGLLSPGADELAARSLARRLVEALPEGVSASTGVATWDRSEGASDLVHRADQAMYHAKRRRN